jgi:hypothetical protein
LYTKRFLDHLNPFGPAFMPFGKKTPVAGLASALVDALYEAPPVTMFKTWLVLREKAITLVESASTSRVAVTLDEPARATENVASPKSSGAVSYVLAGEGATCPARVARKLEIELVSPINPNEPVGSIALIDVRINPA